MIFINTSGLAGSDWRFLEPVSDIPEVRWSFHSGLPRNALEHCVRHPPLAFWRAAAEASREARTEVDPVLVSHLPGMAAATNWFRRYMCPRVPQVAFSFNFTELPAGPRRTFLTSTVRGIDEFVVFSRFERHLYAEYFDIPESRIRFLPWAMDPPVAAPNNPAEGLEPYLCAIGGEGRDYHVVADAMRRLPDVRMVVVARPQNLMGVDIPRNMITFTNLPSSDTWAIAKASMGMVLPLMSETTACGHITLVGAQFLALPLVVTRSRGVEDYVSHGETATLVPAGDAAGMARAITSVLEDPVNSRRMALAAQVRAATANSISTWVTYFRVIATRFAQTYAPVRNCSP